MTPSANRREEVTRPTTPPEGIVLRVMQASDLPHVHVLHRSLLPVSYPAAFFVQLLINPRRLCLVAADHGAIIGFASAAMDPNSSGGCELRDSEADQKCSEPESGSDTPRTHITVLTLGVLPEYQRKGIGRSLVHGVVQRLEASCAAAACPSPDQDNKIAVFVQVQVAQSNAVGKCFYSRLGMMDQRGCDDVRFGFGPGPQTSVMAGVLCV